uniref:Uncharacterized protein n=1 Tax=Arundo donax TaxID=35708 RepID=A0A0A9CV36_ARUDO
MSSSSSSKSSSNSMSSSSSSSSSTTVLAPFTVCLPLSKYCRPVSFFSFGAVRAESGMSLARCSAISASKRSLQAIKLSTVTASPWGTMTSSSSASVSSCSSSPPFCPYFSLSHSLADETRV